MKIAVVGASGAVGQEFLRVFGERNFKFDDMVLFGSARSAGRTYSFGGKDYVVKELKHNDDFAGVDIAFVSAGGGVSKEFAETITKHGAVMIDNSSAFRMDSDVPLVVPEVNAADALVRPRGIIANPNCTTAISLMALCPLHRDFGLKRFFASTYQAVSGTGVAAMEELKSQLKAFVEGRQPEAKVYPYQIAFNVIPHVDVFLEDGYTKEEKKMLNETRKIMELPELQNSTTCVRVPVMRAHSVSINAEFERPVSVGRAREVIAQFPGVEICDDVENKKYPMPLFYQKKVKCGVGRIRRDAIFENGLAFWVAGDQLWKGAALNAVQIAELLASKD